LQATDIDRLANAVVERMRDLRDDRPLLTPTQAAARLAISERTLREMARAGKIARVMVEGAPRYEPASLDAYLAGRRRSEET
jgi:excisionase family DNA binding protein